MASLTRPSARLFQSQFADPITLKNDFTYRVLLGSCALALWNTTSTYPDLSWLCATLALPRAKSRGSNAWQHFIPSRAHFSFRSAASHTPCRSTQFAVQFIVVGISQ